METSLLSTPSSGSTGTLGTLGNPAWPSEATWSHVFDEGFVEKGYTGNTDAGFQTKEAREILFYGLIAGIVVAGILVLIGLIFLIMYLVGDSESGSGTVDEVCQPGSYKANGKCYTCAAGTYSTTTNATSCKQCAAGTAAPSGSTTCTSCLAGQYSGSGAGVCSTCSAGQYSSAGSSTCSTCSAGSYSSAGSSTCTTCAAGKYSSAGASSCSTCAAGSASVAGSESCGLCPAGSFSLAGASTCTLCGKGSYSSLSGSTSCTECGVGETTESTGSSSESACYVETGDCQPGTYKGTDGICYPCAAGTYSSGYNATSCSVCADGTTSVRGSSSCSACPAGTVGTSLGTCVSCAANQYSSAGTSSSRGCSACSAGYVSSAGSSQCTACSAGTYRSSDMSSCQSCAAGKFSASSGASTCLTCSLGTTSSTGASVCVNCAAGTHGVDGGTCTDCGANEYSGEGVATCSTCSAGSTSTAGSSSCTDCAAGYYRTLAMTACGKCPVNTYSASGAGVCTSCTSGTVAPEGSTSSSACQVCAAGTFYETVNGVGVCSTCPVGYYCPSGGSKLACPAGQYNSLTGQSSCTACPKNTYSTSTGATSSSTCVSCATGTVSEAGATACTTCSAGSVASSGSCVQCGTGLVPNSSSTACVSCGAGTYKSGLTSCLSCPIGYYSSGGVDACTACPSGTTTTGTGSTSSSACVASFDSSIRIQYFDEYVPYSTGYYERDTGVYASEYPGCLVVSFKTYLANFKTTVETDNLLAYFPYINTTTGTWILRIAMLTDVSPGFPAQATLAFLGTKVCSATSETSTIDITKPFNFFYNTTLTRAVPTTHNSNQVFYSPSTFGAPSATILTSTGSTVTVQRELFVNGFTAAKAKWDRETTGNLFANIPYIQTSSNAWAVKALIMAQYTYYGTSALPSYPLYNAFFFNTNMMEATGIAWGEVYASTANTRTTNGSATLTDLAKEIDWLIDTGISSTTHYVIPGGVTMGSGNIVDSDRDTTGSGVFGLEAVNDGTTSLINSGVISWKFKVTFWASSKNIVDNNLWVRFLIIPKALVSVVSGTKFYVGGAATV